MSNNINLNCFKCHQPGYRMQDCPYTYQELADMEATGDLITIISTLQITVIQTEIIT